MTIVDPMADRLGLRSKTVKHCLRFSRRKTLSRQINLRYRIPMIVTALAGMTVAVSGLTACQEFGNPANRYLDDIDVAGYTEISRVREVSGAGPWAEALYIGQPVSDVRGIITAPGLSLGDPPAPAADRQAQPDGSANTRYHSSWVAYGDAPNNCHVSVDKGIDNAHDESKLTESQLARINDGSVDILRIHVTCGDG
ncbi:hypothetical protein [Nocardia bovistercoris]|uniref:Uncharacterized protein n=1 Tax=Nocardia bovistercoris TaxID=2785916 RepID=A0A931N0I1_9NOCA|nr:hypothetical protein [Nocardia bovistercoris]MBH0775024.1 hypothetical protein [Nocardia bovistercoris]